jgi:AcrR family transcriptional regulator
MTTLRKSEAERLSAASRRKPRAKPQDRYHHGDLRTALLAEARRRLAHGGPAELSLRELARHLGVSHNAPYKHFATREALLAAVAAAGFRELAARTADGARSQGLHGAGLAYVGFALHDPPVFRLMFSGDIDKATSPELHEAASASFTVLRTHVAAIHGEDAADIAAVSAWSFVHGLANLLIAGQLRTGIAPGGGPLDIADRVLRAYIGRPKDERSHRPAMMPSSI